eukprot:510779-Prorocentrum_minimum.AAC.2
MRRASARQTHVAKRRGTRRVGFLSTTHFLYNALETFARHRGVSRAPLPLLARGCTTRKTITRKKILGFARHRRWKDSLGVEEKSRTHLPQELEGLARGGRKESR